MKIRVLFPVGTEYYLESPWVEVNGKRSFEPVVGQPKWKLTDTVKEALQKGTAAVDNSMSISDVYTASPTGPMVKPMASGITQETENNQISLTLQSAVAGSVVRLGLAGNNLGIFDGAEPVKDMTIGGTFGPETVKVLGNLANYGFVKIKKLHFEASSADVFALTPRFKTYSHVGECKQDKKLYYPKASADDDNTNIRTMDERFLKENDIDLTLNGKNYLEIPVPNGENVNLTLYTCFYPKG
ncbi:hypothetical protein [Aureispira anguillae]|uniref:Uncharacterized protein n=1 Tax=Aureispira anguillae TaxID=2864201 RepID=A0A915YGR1_9BACT|nr:hypothetical protein [Aureispira anguillae]BDS12742.1 hypothetical protein AsAng_0034670 [Aureispira anguillae]